MEFYTTRKPPTKRRNIQHHLVDGLQKDEAYPLSINMYRDPPTEDIMLEEFKELALKRRNLLKEIEYFNSKFQKWGEDWKMRMRDISKSNKLHVDRIDEDSQKIRRRDYISHFLLRLAYSQSEHLRRWMVLHETDLFRYRFENATEVERFEFMSKDPDLKSYSQIEDSEFQLVEESLLESYIKFLRDKINKENVKFYKIPFTLVPNLVSNRSIFIQNGYAYLPSWDLQTIVTSVFRAKLSLALTNTSRKLERARDDERIWKFLTQLDTYYEGPEYRGTSKKNNEKISVGDIEDIFKDSYPLCMINLHTSLKKEHHLKHWGRMQYGLFLKGIGLNMEDSLRFWREEFMKAMDSDKFDKNYAYNIRHHYGREGGKISYSAYSCSKIINNNPPGPVDNHGCPYRHYDKSNLKAMLIAQGIKDKPLRAILDLAENRQYNNACLRYFETKHELEETSLVMDHPNKYFDESRYILKGNRPIQTRGRPPVVTNAPAPMETSAEKAIVPGKENCLLGNFEDFDDLNTQELEALDI
ncbi:DNA primase large subunit-like [Oopsacas minuta]|uniref:DNA primase large subunit n=1 Tax=Oopsacas minuta TaxID=111878 RepID=A0AAV7KHK0_9METZ|nr:DNA primase large subunit-like [Oopsacas minuta]